MSLPVINFSCPSGKRVWGMQGQGMQMFFRPLQINTLWKICSLSLTVGFLFGSSSFWVLISVLYIWNHLCLVVTCTDDFLLQFLSPQETTFKLKKVDLWLKWVMPVQVKELVHQFLLSWRAPQYTKQSTVHIQNYKGPSSAMNSHRLLENLRYWQILVRPVSVTLLQCKNSILPPSLWSV